MKTCFVVQGYGRKTDYRDGRVLDLDASYAIIKDAVEGAGLECIRADEIQHSGTIDLPMYEWLFKADLVIADLSTYNVNAAFELGVRYALRPHATIIVAEEQFQNPFDFSHIAIRRYKHLGEDVGAKEARRFCAELKAAIASIVADTRVDSPIYTFLPQLQPPQDQKALDQAAFAPPPPAAARATPAAHGEAVDLSSRELLGRAQQKIDASDFVGARLLLEEARRRRPNDSDVVQRLALAIYKSKQPDAKSALLGAREVLLALAPDTCNNPETLGLWGAVHKRLWDIDPRPELLDAGITAYARGFALKQDHYSGINFAFLLDLRACEALRAGRRDDAVTDHTLARRMRSDVTALATAHLARLPDDLGDERFWVLASLWEAALGSGDAAALQGWQQQLLAFRVADWMHESWQSQGAKLRALLDEYARLLQAAAPC
jgi:hypothetical protein